jgi:long-subunit fatty acid transport protein
VEPPGATNRAIVWSVKDAGADVPGDRLWTSRAALEALNIAIAVAEAEARNPAAAQAGIDTAASALIGAAKVFNTAKQKGKQPAALRTVTVKGVSFNLRYVEPPSNTAPEPATRQASALAAGWGKPKRPRSCLRR